MGSSAHMHASTHALAHRQCTAWSDEFRIETVPSRQYPQSRCALSDYTYLQLSSTQFWSHTILDANSADGHCLESGSSPEIQEYALRTCTVRLEHSHVDINEHKSPTHWSCNMHYQAHEIIYLCVVLPMSTWAVPRGHYLAQVYCIMSTWYLARITSHKYIASCAC